MLVFFVRFLCKCGDGDHALAQTPAPQAPAPQAPAPPAPALVNSGAIGTGFWQIWCDRDRANLVRYGPAFVVKSGAIGASQIWCDRDLFALVYSRVWPSCLVC